MVRMRADGLQDEHRGHVMDYRRPSPGEPLSYTLTSLIDIVGRRHQRRLMPV
jgi:hypothetical protein